jgi:hypothetical protein
VHTPSPVVPKIIEHVLDAYIGSSYRPAARPPVAQRFLQYGKGFRGGNSKLVEYMRYPAGITHMLDTLTFSAIKKS